MNTDTPDVAAVLADDALLDALGGRGTETPVEAVSDDLSGLLAAWRRECDQPVPALVSPRHPARTLTTRRSTR